MKIKSITDIITNSSSEVFIIKRNKSSKVISSDPISIIENVCKALRVDINKIITWETAKKDGLAVKGWPETKCKKGDLIVKSVEENSIPYSLIELIGDLSRYDKSINSVLWHHLG